MKKAKYLVLSTALATMLMGAGYAAWTDGFKVKNTVEAGELKVSLVAAQEMYDADFANAAWKMDPELKDNTDMKHNSHTDEFDLKMGEPKELTIDQESKTVSFNFQNLYPGCTATTQLSAKNDGTMPAVIGAVDVSDFIYKKLGEDAASSELAAKMLVDYEFVIRNADNGPNANPRMKIAKTDVALTDLETSLKADLEGVYLLPGEEFSWGRDTAGEDGLGYTLKFRIPETLGTEQNPNEGENESIEFDIDFDFVQHNMFEGAVNDNNYKK